MIKQLELVLLPEEAADSGRQLQFAARELNLHPSRIWFIRITRRSIDARQKQVKIRLNAEIYIDENPPRTEYSSRKFNFDRDVSNAEPVLITGFGPAGMFAALRLIELGKKPVVFERGKTVQQRRRDLAAINKQGIVHPDSNYCFGEGGAGTYSDGKLYTRSNKRGDIERILDILILHGADENIRIDAHPHIGTNKLPKIVEAMRNTVLNSGGEVHFETKVLKIIKGDDNFKGVVVKDLKSGEEKEYFSDKMILAAGHSARDIFEMLYNQNIIVEAKPFALGVRIEHPQEIIDTMQYHCEKRSDFLPPASYSLTHQHDGRGVYSFCMCPGGIIAPAATAPGEIVVNGWSPSKRNNPFANSGMVVSILESDYTAFSGPGPLAAMKFQQHFEQQAFNYGNGGLKAPAQRMIDFVNGKLSPTLPECSYVPGVTSSLLTDALPDTVSRALKDAFTSFGKKMKPYLTNEAILLAVESRTSSPVRIPRDKESLEHVSLKGLYPCGEGAGYAGGIVSAAMDGERCAEKASGK